MHIRDQETQITFMDKNIDLIINTKFIGSQQTHRKRVTSYASPRDHYIENSRRERKHLATNYGPEDLQELLTHHQRGTNGSGEPLRDGV